LQQRELLSYDAVGARFDGAPDAAKKLAGSHDVPVVDAFCTQLCATRGPLATFLTGQVLGRWDSI
jgi:hypothetical protein